MTQANHLTNNSGLPSGNLTLLYGYGKSPCSMGKLTISMMMLNSYVKLPEGTKTILDDLGMVRLANIKSTSGRPLSKNLRDI